MERGMKKESRKQNVIPIKKRVHRKKSPVDDAMIFLGCCILLAIGAMFFMNPKKDTIETESENVASIIEEKKTPKKINEERKVPVKENEERKVPIKENEERKVPVKENEERKVPVKLVESKKEVYFGKTSKIVDEIAEKLKPDKTMKMRFETLSELPTFIEKEDLDYRKLVPELIALYKDCNLLPYKHIDTKNLSENEFLALFRRDTEFGATILRSVIIATLSNMGNDAKEAVPYLIEVMFQDDYYAYPIGDALGKITGEEDAAARLSLHADHQYKNDPRLLKIKSKQELIYILEQASK